MTSGPPFIGDAIALRSSARERMPESTFYFGNALNSRVTAGLYGEYAGTPHAFCLTNISDESLDRKHAT